MLPRTHTGAIAFSALTNPGAPFPALAKRVRAAQTHVRMTVAARETALIADLSILPSWQERLEELLRRDRRRPGLDPAERSEAHRIPGCVSRVWLVAAREGDRCRFRSDAEAPAVRALVGTLAALYDDATPAEITTHEPTFLAGLDLEKHLSGTRRDALTKARDAIRSFATARH
jgi:cysteine desulfuration protein SufE